VESVYLRINNNKKAFEENRRAGRKTSEVYKSQKQSVQIVVDPVYQSQGEQCGPRAELRNGHWY
jgi:hypothetical protein